MSFPTSLVKRITTLNSRSLRFSLNQTTRYFSLQQTSRMAANLDSETISKITEKEKELTGEDAPVSGGPTAQAQSHAGETINSRTLHDITEGEKAVTGGERVKGGPTSTAQSILSKVMNSSPPFLTFVSNITLRVVNRLPLMNSIPGSSTLPPFPRSMPRRAS